MAAMIGIAPAADGQELDFLLEDSGPAPAESRGSDPDADTGGAAGAAEAEEQPESGESSRDRAVTPERRSTIEEIIVTAQKRSASIQDVPVSMTALAGEDVDFREIRNQTDLQYQVPNLNVSESAGSLFVTLRGVGINVDTGAAEPGVASHVDGVFQPRNTTGGINFIDLERVEVLRGPQGTLYGRNATGGAINFVLSKPTDELTGSARLGYGSFDTFDLRGVVSGPVVPGLLNARLVGLFHDTGGTVENLVNGNRVDERTSKGGRFALSAFPFDGVTADFSLLYRDEEGVQPRDVIVRPPQPDLEAMVGIFPPTQANPDDYVLGDPHRVKLNRPPTGETDTLNGALTLEWDFGFATAKSLTGYQNHDLFHRYDGDFTARDIFAIVGRTDSTRSISEELTVSGANAWLDWIVGGYFFQEDYRIFLPIDLPATVGGAGLAVRFTGVEDIQALAGFGDATISVTDSVRIFGGGRFSRDDKTMVQTVLTLAGSGIVPPVIGVPTVPGVATSCEGNRVEQTFEDFTPRYGVQWDAWDDIMLYAQQSFGFKSGGVNFTVCDNFYEPEEVDSKELGVKSTWLDGALVANLSAFFNDYEDFQVFKIVGLEGRVVNADSASIDGVELETFFRPIDGLSLSFAFSYLDAVYDEFTDTDPADPDAGEQDLSGVSLNRAPKYTLNLGGEYEWPIPIEWLGRLRVRGEWFLTDDVRYRQFRADFNVQEGYSLVNFFVSATSATDAFELRVFGKNVADTDYFTNVQADQIGRAYGPGGDPRRFGAEIVARF